MGWPGLVVAVAVALLLGTVSAQRTSCITVTDAIFAAGDYTFAAGGESCRSTYAVITIEFNAVVVSATVDVDDGETAFSDNSVVFVVPDLGANPAYFIVELDTCGEIEGTDIIANWAYADAEGNTPEETAFEDTGVVPAICTTRLWPSFPTVEFAATWGSWDGWNDDLSGSYSMSYSWSFSYDWWVYDDDTPRCSSGVVGVDGAFDTCCSVECGVCGVSDCIDMGADECCSAAIVAADVSCSVSSEAPCVQY